MFMMTKKAIERFRQYRSKNLAFIGRFLIHCGLTANIITFFSFVTGMAAVYFLFEKYYLFLLFAALHLLADSLDGVLARQTIPTVVGKWFDFGTDSLVTILLLLKIAWFVNDYYLYLLVGLYTLSLVAYSFSHLQAPILFTRTLTIILCALAVPPLLGKTFLPLTIISLCSGVAALYSLTRQLQWFLQNKH